MVIARRLMASAERRTAGTSASSVSHGRSAANTAYCATPSSASTAVGGFSASKRFAGEAPIAIQVAPPASATTAVARAGCSAVCEPQPQLLHEQPHEEQVREPDRLHPCHETEAVDGEDSRAEGDKRCPWRAVVHGNHRGDQGRAQHVHAEEPQGLADAPSSSRNDRRVDAEQRKRRKDGCRSTRREQRNR